MRRKLSDRRIVTASGVSVRRVRRGGEEGTILLMVPAGLLVMIMLGAMAFDMSLAYAGERRIADLAAGWANDALVRIDLDQFYAADDQEIRLDQDAARAAVRDAWLALDDPGVILANPPLVSFPDPLTIRVEIVGEVPLLFLDVVPGVHSRVIDTVSTASLVVTG